MPLAILLATAAVTWPALLGLALADRIDAPASTMSTVVYAAASRVCHQRADRSFTTRGQQWPVCARCAGLYLAAPLGALAAALARPRGRRTLGRVVVVAAAPTMAAWLLEAAAGVPVPGVVRMALAVPLGAAVAFTLVTLARAGNRIG